MEITLPLDQVTFEENLRAMDAIWADLSRDEDDVPSLAWRGLVLREREDRDGPTKKSRFRANKLSVNFASTSSSNDR